MGPGEDGEQARARRQALRWALAMAGAGVLLLLATFVIADERWRVVAMIFGGLLAGVGVLTVAWARVEESVPWRHRD